MTLATSVDNPSQTPLSHLEGRTILTKTDVVDRVEGVQGKYLKRIKKKFSVQEAHPSLVLNFLWKLNNCLWGLLQECRVEQV
jgi:hypothetical protein